MSSFSATFKVDGKEFDVLSSNYSFTQMTDEKGRPASRVHAGQIGLSFVINDDEKILEWMVDSDKKMASGSIVFNKIDQDSALKEIKFEDAYCVSYSEGFAANVPDSMVASISISARKITVGNVTHEENW